MEEVEETYNEPQAKFSTIGNLESAKRAFFNNQHDEFTKAIDQKEYKYMKCIYKYSSDYDNRPEFIARNFNRGLAKDLDDYRKYFMCVFRCIKKENNTYEYVSYWIVNTNDSIDKIIGSRYDDFEWNETDKTLFIEKFNKSNEESVISEDYVH